MTLAGWEGKDKPSFETVLKEQIEALRKQLDKPLFTNRFYCGTSEKARPSLPNHPGGERDVRALMDALSETSIRSDNPRRLFETRPQPQAPALRSDRNVRRLLDTLSSGLVRDGSTARAYDTFVPESMQHASQLPTVPPGGRDSRVVLDRVTRQSERDLVFGHQEGHEQYFIFNP